MQRTRSSLFVLAPLFALVLGAFALAGPQQAGPPRGGPPQGDQGNELIAALKASPGCIGVEAAFTQSRKSVVFAWFKDKKAVLDWYYGDYHQTLMMGMQESAAAEAAAKSAESKPEGAGAAAESHGSNESHGALEFVDDESSPVLCIATITPAAPGKGEMVPGFPMPISQISIELYAPLPGGIAYNGKFAPAALKVPHMVEVTPPPAAAKTDAPAPAAGTKGT